MKKRILSTLLALCMALTLLPGWAGAVGIESNQSDPNFGIFGDNAHWIFSDDGTLTIGGLGATKNYKLIYENDGRIYPNNPWTDGFWSGLRYKIKTIDIKRGITAIGDYGFCECFLAETVAITSNVTRIGECAFFFCDSLKDVYYTGNKAQWEKIDIAEGNDPLKTATIHYNYNGGSSSDTLTAHFSNNSSSASISADKSVDIKWNAIAGASSYYIDFLDAGTCTPSFSGTTYTLSKMSVGTHRMKVVALVGNKRVESNELTLEVTSASQPDTPSQPEQPSTPAPVIELVSTSDTAFGTVCTVKWGAVSGAASYYVTAHNTETGTYSSVPITGTSAEITLTVKGPYKIYVAAVSADGTSGPISNVLQITVDEAPINRSEVFLKQKKGSSECIVTASTIMMRRRAILEGRENWSSFVVNNVKKKALDNGNLKWDFTYDGMTVIKGDFSASRSKRDQLIDLLRQHKEGIVVFDESGISGVRKSHGVLLTDYDANTETFYCSDTSNGAPSGRIPLTESTMYPGHGENEIINLLDKYWYISGSTGVSKKVIDIVAGSACPVEMVLTVQGHVLDSRNMTGTQSNAYASMTANGSGSDRNIKVQISGDDKIGDQTSIRLLGTDTGVMTFYITKHYSDGSSETQTFQNVPLTSTTVGDINDFDPQSTTTITMTDSADTGKLTFWVAEPGETVNGPYTDFIKIDEADSEFSPPSIFPATHTLTIPAVTGGTVTAVPSFPSAGDGVTLTAAPDEGCELTGLTVANRYGQNVPVTDLGNGRYAFTMPDAGVTVNPVFTKIVSNPLSSLLPGAGSGSTGYMDIIYPGPAMSFTDVQPYDWFYDSVNYVYTRRLMNGVSETAFEPQGATSRAMIWTILARLSGKDTTGGESWYERGQIWAMGKGITDGTAPQGDITREQLATMLWRFKGSPYAEGERLSAFTDGASVSSYAVSAANWAVANGLMNGSNGKLNPQGAATRAEVATILQRFCQTYA